MVFGPMSSREYALKWKQKRVIIGELFRNYPLVLYSESNLYRIVAARK